MPWILLKKKLPTDPSPPKMSLFYATPWTDKSMVESQQERIKNDWLEPLGDGALMNWRGNGRGSWPEGMEHDWSGAMAIEYKDQVLRVFPDEYQVQTADKMHLWVFGDGKPGGEPTHILEQNNAASAFLLRQALETDLRLLFDAALLDGCNEQQAMAVTMGMDITDEEIEFPNIGWYRPTELVLDMFCYEWEATG